MLVKVEGNDSLSRDMYSKAIINTSSEGYKAAIESRNRRVSLESRFSTIDKEISSIKNDISNILSILKENVCK